jgi:hypothetical protein
VVHHEPAEAVAEIEVGLTPIRRVGAAETAVLRTDDEEGPEYIEYLGYSDRGCLSVCEELGEEIEAHLRP